MSNPDLTIAMVAHPDRRGPGKLSGDSTAPEVLIHTDAGDRSTTAEVPASPAGFDEAFDALAAISYRVAYRILGSRAAAEDVSQETLTRAYLHWRKVHKHAEPWVARVAGNLAIDAWRHRQAEPASSARQNPGGHDRVLDRMVLADLLRRLPKRQRQVLVLRYLADQSEADTAAALGCSVGAVKRHAHRAFEALRACTVADGPKGNSDV